MSSLLALRPLLVKENWEKNPAAVKCFAWSLSLVRTNQLAVKLKTDFGKQEPADKVRTAFYGNYAYK